MKELNFTSVWNHLVDGEKVNRSESRSWDTAGFTEVRGLQEENTSSGQGGLRAYGCTVNHEMPSLGIISSSARVIALRCTLYSEIALLY